MVLTFVPQMQGQSIDTRLGYKQTPSEPKSLSGQLRASCSWVTGGHQHGVSARGTSAKVQQP